MGYTKKDGGFDRRTTTGKNLDLASDVVGGVAKGVILAGEGAVIAGKVAAKGAVIAGEGAVIAGKFVGKKVGEQIEKSKQRKTNREEIKNQLQGLREEDPSGYIKSRQWAMLVRELLELSEGWEGAQKVEKEPEIKKQLKEIKDQDPSGYIKINKFWYSAEKKLNKYFDKQVEEQLKEENPE